MKPKFLIVYLKEFRETLRDRRAMALLTLFVLMYPVLCSVLLQRMITNANKPEREGIDMVVIGAAQAPTLMSQLKQNNISVQRRDAMTEADITTLLRQRTTVAVLRLSDKFDRDYQAMRPARVELWFDSGADTDNKQREIEDVLRSYSAGIAGGRLLAHGVSPVTMAPIQLQRYDTGSNATRSTRVIGALLASLFLPAFFFCMSAAVDATAGERERRSLEVLLAQPARARDLIIGKWLAAGTLSVLGLSLELLAAHLLLKWLPLEEIGLSWNMSGLQLLAVCVAAWPLALFAAAIEIALAMSARSFKEAQSVVSLAVLFASVPTFALPMLDLPTRLWMYLVPLVSNQTLLLEVAKGQHVGWLPFVLTFSCSAVAAALAVAFASWRMQSERYVSAV